MLLPSFVMATVCAGEASSAAADAAPPRRLSASAEGYYYYVPSDVDAVLGIGSIDLGRVHVEGRYNYEALRTGSVFVGPRFDFLLFGRLKLSLTPMLGMVLGRTKGGALGFELDATVGKLELSSESELVLDSADPARSFFYTWSELTLRPVAWLSGGLVLQRTRFVGESKIVEHGGLVGVTLGPLDLSAYVFAPFSSGRYYAFAIGASF